MQKVEQDSSKQEEKRGWPSTPIVTFIICLIISALLWAIMSLSREYTVTYTYQVNCVDIPEGRILNQLSENTLSLTFKAKGFGLLNPCFMKKNRRINLSITKLYHHKGAVETATFTQKELTDYLREFDDLAPSFIGVSAPGAITVYFR